ncbi:MAG: TipAS antibiotic-recognition domain-containing protein [Planctomycetota bacterium]|nr:TipAS antibiotic-recognition domain-containing protein [Planctomycetota bacterium]
MDHANAKKDGFQEFIQGKESDEFSQVRISEFGENCAEAERILLEKTIDSSSRNDWTREDWENNQRQVLAVFNEIAKAEQAGHSVDSEVVQQWVRKHYEHSKAFYTMSPPVYTAMAELFQYHPAFRGQLEPIHPTLPEFLAKAMAVFVARS